MANFTFKKTFWSGGYITVESHMIASLSREDNTLFSHTRVNEGSCCCHCCCWECSVARSNLAKFTLDAQNLAIHKAVNKGKIFGKCFVFWRRQFHDKPNQFAGISCLNHVHIMFDVAKANKTARLLQHFVSAMCVKERVKHFSDLIFLWAFAWIIFVISNIKELGKHK